MQWSALKNKQQICTEFTADSLAYFCLMKNIPCLDMNLHELSDYTRVIV